ncbi:MAG: DNA-3-methyladenine glycosylase [Rickettsiales bacterium]|jgi:DNA-3-methyladenine glycosylase|nr:DNA-3-methyladenine glycosylase [Rickettsiales bacterium]
MTSRLAQGFYDHDPFDIARALLGCLLCTNLDGRTAKGRIAELEVYLGGHDKASHTYGFRRTARTEITFHGPNLAYIFGIYGKYFQFCITIGNAGAILVRALEPVEGIELMADRRRFSSVIPAKAGNLTDGPGRLCQALGITRELYGEDLSGDRIWLEPSAALPSGIETAKRIGIGYAEEYADKPWRFIAKF